jgi:ABC-type multidrug transport system ATPase subunit
MSAYLEISNLTKTYGAAPALREVSLSINRGDVVAILGPNGAGKSTLFGCLLGLTLPDSGKFLLQGRTPSPSTRAKFGYVAERVALYPHRSVADNAAFFARLKGNTAAQAEEQLRRVGLSEVRGRKVLQLSKGMLQRLGLAIALCGSPELLILDEPFNGLDPALLDTFQSILREEQQRGATLLISTHTMSAVEPLLSHVAILLAGRLAVHKPLAELQHDFAPGASLEEIYHYIARSKLASNQIEVTA